MSKQVFEQSIQINASATVVEQCFTDLSLMHRWLNPALRCEPIGDWSTAIGSKSQSDSFTNAFTGASYDHIHIIKVKII